MEEAGKGVPGFEVAALPALYPQGGEIEHLLGLALEAHEVEHILDGGAHGDDDILGVGDGGAVYGNHLLHQGHSRADVLAPCPPPASAAAGAWPTAPST